MLYDFPGEAVAAIAPSGKGTVFVTVNEGTGLVETRRSGAGTRPQSPGATASVIPRPGKGSLYRIDAKDRPERLMHHDDFDYRSLAVDSLGVPYVGTSVEGRVYTVDDAHVVTLLADTDDRNVSAIGFTRGKPYLITSDRAFFHGILADAPAPVWTSKVLDAGLRAQFGHLAWRSAGAVKLSTRTGNTEKPDRSWSDWSTPELLRPGRVGSPAGRFVQVRARWVDGQASLDEVTLPFVTENTRPIVTSVTARQSGTVSPTHEGIVASGSAPAKHSTMVTIGWSVDNPDHDLLRFHLTFRREGQALWREVLRPEETLASPKSEYEWDTQALPEGKYSVRVEASDEMSNPPDQAQRHALESFPILVDNTPPRITASMTGRQLKAHVIDGLGPIVRVEMAVDGKVDWRPLGAADGLFDTEDESVDTDLARVIPSGVHILALRAYDAAGNAGTFELETPP